MSAMARKNRDRSSVRTYRNFDDLKDCLASGYSPRSTRSYLVEMHHDNPPSEVAIRRWRNQHLETYHVVPADYIDKQLGGVRYKVDLLRHYADIIPVMRDRVGRALEFEKEQLSNMPSPVTDQAVRTFLDVLREYRTVAQDLGVMTKAKQDPLIDARTQIANLNVFPPEVQDAMLETEKMIRIIEATPIQQLIEEAKK